MEVAPIQSFGPVGGVPVGAWVGLGIGASCSLGAVAYNYVIGAATIAEASRSAGVICALLGTTLGIMGAIRGWARSRATAA
jgi:hypothetical protein